MALNPYSYGGQSDAYYIASAAAGALVGVLLLVLMLVLAFSLVLYIFKAIGMYSIAKRRGLRNAWLAWIPVGNSWILGSISDQYQYVARGNVQNRRKLLLGLAIAMAVCGGASVPAGLASVWETVNYYGDSAGVALSGVGLGVILGMAGSVIGIVNLVFEYICLYNLYVSCRPDEAVLFLVLSIVLPVTMPFFVFSCRKRDDGMPPRRDGFQQNGGGCNPGWNPNACNPNANNPNFNNSGTYSPNNYAQGGQQPQPGYGAFRQGAGQPDPWNNPGNTRNGVDENN